MAIYGIKAVKYCLSKNLLHYVDADAGGSTPEQIEVFNPATGKCTVTNPLTTLPCLIGTKATLTVDDAVVNRRHQYTARLTFVTATDPELDGEYYAFVVETNEGERMLLGSKVAPRCSVTTRQNVAATAGDVNGYTTTVDFKAPYAPLHLPAAAAPAPDTRSLDVCCGQIVQDRPADTREFDVCCGEIRGEAAPTLLTVRWLNGDGSLLDSKTYYSNQPEPTTTAVPTKAATSEYTYTFDHWQVQSVVGTVKTYEPIFNAVPVAVTITVIWQDEDGTELERKTYTEGSPEPSPTSTPGPKVINELFGKQFSTWTLYSDTNNTKIYRASYVVGVFDWSTVEPTGTQNADTKNNDYYVGALATWFKPLNSPDRAKSWIFYSWDGSTILKSPFYDPIVPSVDVYKAFNYGNIPCMVIIFCYDNVTKIEDSGLDPGTQGVRWLAHTVSGQNTVYGFMTSDWQGLVPQNGVFIPITS